MVETLQTEIASQQSDAWYQRAQVVSKDTRRARMLHEDWVNLYIAIHLAPVIGESTINLWRVNPLLAESALPAIGVVQ